MMIPQTPGLKVKESQVKGLDVAVTGFPRVHLHVTIMLPAEHPSLLADTTIVEIARMSIHPLPLHQLVDGGTTVIALVLALAC
jgi:hypothetical protein